MSLGDILLKFCPGESPILSIDCSLDSQFLAVAQISGRDGCPTLSLVDLDTGKTNKIIEKSSDGKNSVWKVKFNMTSSKLIYIFQLVGKFSLISYDLKIDERQVIKKAERQVELNGYTIEPNDDLLVLPTKENSLEFWNLEDLNVLKKVKLKESLEPISIDASIILAYSLNGIFLALGGTKEGTILIYNADNYELIHKLFASFNFPGQILFDNKSELLVTIDFWQRGVFIWDVRKGERYLSKKFNKDLLKASCLAISPDNQNIVLGYKTGRVVVFNLETGERLFSGKLHDARIYDICITSDGKKLISAGEDWEIVVTSIENMP